MIGQMVKLEQAKAELECRIQERTLALAVANDTLARQAQRLQLLHEIDRAILAAHWPAEIAQAAAEGVLRITAAARVNVALWQPQGDSVEVLASAGLVNPFVMPGTTIPRRPWPWFASASQGQIAFQEDLTQRSD